MATDKKKPMATLIIEVHYDELPEKDNINEILDTANQMGSVEKATLSIHTPTSIDVTGGWD